MSVGVSVNVVLAVTVSAVTAAAVRSAVTLTVSVAGTVTLTVTMTVLALVQVFASLDPQPEERGHDFGEAHEAADLDCVGWVVAPAAGCQEGHIGPVVEYLQQGKDPQHQYSTAIDTILGYCTVLT